MHKARKYCISHTHTLLATCSDSYCMLFTFTWVLYGGAVWTHGQWKLCWVTGIAHT